MPFSRVSSLGIKLVSLRSPALVDGFFTSSATYLLLQMGKMKLQEIKTCNKCKGDKVLSAFTYLASMGSANCRLKICWKKKIPESSKKAKPEFFRQATVYITFT